MNNLWQAWIRAQAVFAPPIFKDQEKTRVAALLNTILYSLIILLVAVNTILVITSLVTQQAPPDPLVSVIATAIFIGLIVLMRLGFVKQVSLLLSFVASGIITLSLFRSENLISVTTTGYIIAIIIAGLLSGGWSALLVALFSFLCLGGLNYSAVQGIIQAKPLATTDLITFGALFSMSALLLGLASRSIAEALENARRNEIAQFEANENLRNLQANLEQHVAHRTKALLTSTEVSRRLSTILDRRQLVAEVVEQVQSAFNYYHAHIYLRDETSGDLIMAGGTGEAGTIMLARGHRVPKGRGLVGRAADTNTPMLVPDVTKEDDWLPNPLLPGTKSEVSVPIASGNKVLGVLDVQQDAVNGLNKNDVELLQALASQVAISLQNAQLLEAARAKTELETFANTIGQKIQQTSTLEETLQTAIRELGVALGATRVKVNIQSVSKQEQA